MKKNIDGVDVDLTPEEEAALLTEWAAVVPPRRLIPKSTVQERAQTEGKLEAILALLRSNGYGIYYARWFAPDWPNVYFDDEGMLAMLAGVGCSAEQIARITAPV